MVWDGRYELTARREGLSVGPLCGRMAGLESIEKSNLLSIPAAARGALPVVLEPGRPPTCPVLAGRGANTGGMTVSGLAEHRFMAACGMIEREGDRLVVADVANGAQSSYVGGEAKGVCE